MATENKNKENLKNKVGFSISELKPMPGSHHRPKIVGRGVGSGHGRHATRGMKGQSSRSGDTKMTGFEGGQMPIIRRIPKRGFTPPFRTIYQVLNVNDLDFLFKANDTVSPEVLFERGILKRNLPIKILGNGNLTKPLKVSVHAASKGAQEKLQKAGGTLELLSSTKK